MKDLIPFFEEEEEEERRKKKEDLIPIQKYRHIFLLFLCVFGRN
jgi:hypothetical protein